MTDPKDNNSIIVGAHIIPPLPVATSTQEVASLATSHTNFHTHDFNPPNHFISHIASTLSPEEKNFLSKIDKTFSPNPGVDETSVLSKYVTTKRLDIRTTKKNFYDACGHYGQNFCNYVESYALDCTLDNLHSQNVAWKTFLQHIDKINLKDDKAVIEIDAIAGFHESFIQNYPKYLISMGMPEHCSKLAVEFYKENRQQADRLRQIHIALAAEEYLHAWAADNLYYSKSIFRNPEEIHAFIRILEQYFVDDLLQVSLVKDRINGVLEIRPALQKLEEKLLAIESQHWPRLQAEAERKARQSEKREKQRTDNTLAQEQADERRHKEHIARLKQLSDDKQAKHDEFMKVHQPYPLKNMDAVMHGLEDYGKRSDSAGCKARLLQELIVDTAKQLDCRDPDQKELGELLFSPTNLANAAAAFGLDRSVHGFSAAPTKFSSGGAAQLRSLYRSGAVKMHVDHWLTKSDGMLLVAALARPAAKYKSYADKMAACRKFHEATHAARAHQELSGFSDEELEQIKDEPHVNKWLKQREYFGDAYKELEFAAVDLRSQITQVLRGVPTRKVNGGVTPEKMEAATATKAHDLPNAWQPLLQHIPVGEFHAELIEDDGPSHVKICSDEFTTLSHPFTRTPDVPTLQKKIKELRARCEQHRQNLLLIDALIVECGFRRTKQGAYLEHPEYGISIALHGEETKQTEALLAAPESFDKMHGMQMAAIESAKAAGLRFEGLSQHRKPSHPMMVDCPAHPEVKPFMLARPRGYFERDDFTVLQDAVEHAQIPSPASLPPEEELTAEQKKPRLWQPQADEHMAVFDTGPVRRLAALREGKAGHTWLDLIKKTARLPKLKVIIPAVVAKWELEGQIPVYDKDGHITKWEQISPRVLRDGHIRHDFVAPIEQFLRSASHAYATKDPHGKELVTLVPGENTNIIVWHTKGDRQLYDRIRKIVEGPKDLIVEQLKEHIYKKGEGEKAINRVLEENPTVSATVITEDIKHAHGPDAPRTTSCGMPVGYAGLGTYLQAECGARSKVLRGMLGEEQTLSPRSILDSINRHQMSLHESPYEISFYNDCGTSRKNGVTASSLGEVIASNWSHPHRTSPDAKPQGSNGSAGGRTWANPDQRHETQPAGITPDTVKDRPGTGTGTGGPK